jgi:heme/copper-type cytochrome/quinol oxidase subunit 1
MGEIEAGQGDAPESNRSHRVSAWMVGLGAVAAVIGLVLLLLPSNHASVGWYAYAPLSDSTFFPPVGLLSPQSQIGMVVFIVGLVVLAFGAGWMLGKHQAAGRSRQVRTSN